MSNKLPAWLIAAVRTGTASLVGWLWVQDWVVDGVEWAGDTFGFVVTQEQVAGAALVAAITSVTAFVNWVAPKTVFGKPVGEWINSVFSLFTNKGAAAYDQASDTEVVRTA